MTDRHHRGSANSRRLAGILALLALAGEVHASPPRPPPAQDHWLLERMECFAARLFERALTPLLAASPELTVEPDLESTLVTPSRDGRAPALAYFAIQVAPLEVVDGHVSVPLTTFGERLVASTGGCKTSGCEALLTQHGSRPVPDFMRTCTAVFIEENAILTAGHCVKGWLWNTTYVMLGDVSVAEQAESVRVPVSQFARLHCIRGGEWDQSIPDWVVIQVTPLNEEASLAAHHTLRPGLPDPNIPIKVHSQLFRVPFVHAAERMTDPDHVRVTHAMGGSGAAVVQGSAVVAVVSGNDHFGDRECGPEDPCGQDVTWTTHILRELDKEDPPQLKFDLFQPPTCNKAKESPQ